MPLLEELELSKNQLTSLPANVFNHNTGLVSLGLGHNKLTNLAADIFKYNTELVSLGLCCNEALTNLPADIFKYNTELKTLYLETNGLADLPFPAKTKKRARGPP